MGKNFEICDAELKDASRSGRAFLQWEAMRQIALNLARIADFLEEMNKNAVATTWRPAEFRWEDPDV